MAGNATVKLHNGSSVKSYRVWIQSLNTSTENQFATQQVRTGISWIPIRRSEMFLEFTIVWPNITIPDRKVPRMKGFEDIDPANGFAMMNKFQDAIRTHQQGIATGTLGNVAMELIYDNNSAASSANRNPLISQKALTPLHYKGWIQSVQKSYERYASNYTRTYYMNILTNDTSNSALSAVLPSTNNTFAPTAADLDLYRTNGYAWWENIPAMAQLAENSISGLPKQLR